MKLLITIALLSIFATCSKSATVILDNSGSVTQDGHKIIYRHAFFVSGPYPVTFANQDSEVVSVTGTKPGDYVIGTIVKDDRNLSDTCYSYINATGK